MAYATVAELQALVGKPLGGSSTSRVNAAGIAVSDTAYTDDTLQQKLDAASAEVDAIAKGRTTVPSDSYYAKELVLNRAAWEILAANAADTEMTGTRVRADYFKALYDDLRRQAVIRPAVFGGVESPLICIV